MSTIGCKAEKDVSINSKADKLSDHTQTTISDSQFSTDESAKICKEEFELEHEILSKDSKDEKDSTTNTTPKKEETEKPEKPRKNTFIFCINCFSLLASFGFFFMCYKYSNFWEENKHIIPEGYVVPSIYDLKYLLISMFAILCLKLIIETIGKPIAKRIISPKYKAVNNPDNPEIEEMMIKKMSTSIFKLTYFILIVSIGHLIVRELDYFPKELFGRGEFHTLFYERQDLNLPEGIPHYIFYNKVKYFDIYYLTSLAYSVVDIIWLLFIYNQSSDFQLMRLHHICTISLVLFSYLTNGSPIGIVIFYLHDLTDIFVYASRIIINTCAKDGPKLFVCALLLLSFLYYRIYYFGYLIYMCYYNLAYWHIFNIFMFSFICLLIVMHLWWVYSIIKRFFYLKIEDIGKIKVAKKK